MHVLATAGHVDHGKSTLVRALTGMEPDRLAEEKRRGLTIELGYVWTTLPDRTQLAFVDVPGHERFIGTMLAGLGPAPAVLFVVAADAGWSRQSDDHLAAVDALQLRHGLLAITRSDLADSATTERTVRESVERIARSSLTDVEHVVVSGTKGDGIEQLRAGLVRLVRRVPAPDLDAPVRLWIDRAFSIRGAGTVVTGTLAAGSVRVGDELLLDDRRVVVRGLESLGDRRDHVEAPARVALNLRGVATGELGRGDVLLTPGRWHRTDIVDVRRTTGTAGTELRDDLVLHIGTAALTVHARPLDERTARLTFPRALPLRAGDRAVLHDPGRHTIVGGALVLDADPPPLRRRGAARRRATELAGATGLPDFATELARRGAVRADHLAALGIPTADAIAVAGWYVSDERRTEWRANAPAQVAAFLDGHPLEPGMPFPALAKALALPDPALLEHVLAGLDLAVADGRVRTSSVPANPAEAAIRTLEQRLRNRPFDAPERDELRELGLGRRELAAAQRAGRLLVVADEIVLLPDAPERAAEALGEIEAPFTASAARIALHTTRRVCVPLLELLDVRGVTERLDERHRRLRT